jgi:hypothetical protein
MESTAAQHASSNGALLGRDEILNAQDQQHKDVDVPEWGGTVRVKALSGTERDAYEQSLLSGVGKTTRVDMSNVRAKLASRTMVDKNGELLFTLRDVERLGKKSAAALDRVYEVACHLAKITKEDIEDLKGNSESDPSDAS